MLGEGVQTLSMKMRGVNTKMQDRKGGHYQRPASRAREPAIVQRSRFPIPEYSSPRESVGPGGDHMNQGRSLERAMEDESDTKERCQKVDA